MIRSCKYCLSQTHLCPRCEGSVLVRKITEWMRGEAFSTSLILCTNIACQDYGIFKQQSVNAIEVYVCAACAQAQRESPPNERIA